MTSSIKAPPIQNVNFSVNMALKLLKRHLLNDASPQKNLGRKPFHATLSQIWAWQISTLQLKLMQKRTFRNKWPLNKTQGALYESQKAEPIRISEVLHQWLVTSLRCMNTSSQWMSLMKKQKKGHIDQNITHRHRFTVVSKIISIQGTTSVI